MNLKVQCGITTQISCLCMAHNRCPLDLDFFPSGLFRSQLWSTTVVQGPTQVQLRRENLEVWDGVSSGHHKDVYGCGNATGIKYSQWLAGKPTHFNLLLSLWISLIEYIDFQKIPQKWWLEASMEIIKMPCDPQTEEDSLGTPKPVYPRPILCLSGHSSLGYGVAPFSGWLASQAESQERIVQGSLYHLINSFNNYLLSPHTKKVTQEVTCVNYLNCDHFTICVCARVRTHMYMYIYIKTSGATS